MKASAASLAPPKRFLVTSLAIATALVAISSSSAQTWTGNATTGNWTDNANWSSAPAFDTSTDLTFYQVGAANLSNFIGGNLTARSLTFNADVDDTTTIRLTTEAANNIPANLTLNGGGSGVSITVNSGAAGAITLGVGTIASGNGTVILAENLIINHDGSGTLILSNQFQETGGNRSITKNGNGTIQLFGGNAFSGGLIINQGTVIASSGVMGDLGAGGNVITVTGGNGTLLFNKINPVAYTNKLFVIGSAGGTIIYNETSAANNTLTISPGSVGHFTTLNGNLLLKNESSTAGTDAIVWTQNITGSGRIAFEGNNSLSNNLTDRRVQFGGNDNSGWSGGLQVRKGSANFTTNAAAGTGDYILGYTDGPEAAAIYTAATGTFTNNVTVTSGSARILRGTASGTTWAGAFSLAGDLTYDVFDTSSLLNTISGNITGAGGLIKTGNGTLTLNGSNTYTGNSEIRRGTLTVDDGGSLRFVIGDKGIDNHFTNNASLILNGSLVMDLTGTSTTAGDSWKIIRGNVPTYGESFSIASTKGTFTNINGNWTIDENGFTYHFVQSTGVLSVGPLGGPNPVDTDGDGISDYDEINVHGTNPLLSDSDGDGLSDWQEINITQSNPLSSDSDGNGISDGDEDTDNDGFSNSQEVTSGSDHRNPASIPGDIDGDGLSDAWEMANFGNLDAQSANGDPDNDGLENFREETLGTNPTLIDSDGDGLSDGFEMGLGRYESVLGLFTWAEAKADAEFMGGILAAFPTELDWILAMRSIGEESLWDVNGLWIGATDKDQESTWTWITGESFGFSNWATGEPNDLNDSDYAAVSGDLGGQIGKWYDFRATITRDGYILRTGHATSPINADSDDDGLTDGEEYSRGTHPLLADSDGDGLTDSEEVLLTQTNPLLVDSNGNGVSDADDDQDGDGLSNLAELLTHGTNPLLTDSDGDTLSDHEEIELTLTNPNESDTDGNSIADGEEDPDGDGLGNLAEVRIHGSNPLLADSDGDGLTDREEIQLTVTNPNLADSNENGISDGEEDTDGDSLGNLAELRTHGTNPSLADTDDDGLDDGQEISVHGTDPKLADSDDDGLSDAQEINTYGSDPLDPDTDRDGLKDGDEVARGTDPRGPDSDGDGLSDRDEVELYGSNPLRTDTDSDGFDDSFEVFSGFDPASATSTPEVQTSVRTAVEFRFNAAKDVSYRIESSSDLVEWTTIEAEVIGQGGMVQRFYSIENQPKRYFRVRRN